MWQNTQSSITLYVYGVGECKSLYLFPYATGVEYHAQNREIKMLAAGIAWVYGTVKRNGNPFRYRYEK